MSWSTEQQRLLSAMGYTLYRQASALPPANPAPARGQDAPAAHSMPAVAAANAGRPSGQLLQALQRAAAGREVASLVGDIDALRADPRMKRALWPRLRALRRPH